MASTILTQAIGITNTTINLANTTGFAVNGGIVTINSEQIKYITASDTQLITCTRGYNSTTAASHVDGSTVTFDSAIPTPVDDVTSIKADSNVQLTGDVELVSGTNVTLSQTGQSITVNATSGGGTPGGNNTDVQFNNSGVFAGSDSFTWDNADGTLTIQAGTGNLPLSLFQPAATSFNNFQISNVDSDQFVFSVNGSNNTLTILDNSEGTNQPAICITETNTVGFATSTTDASALVEMSSTVQGFLPPRMTTTQKDGIGSPAEGLIVYDLTLHKLSVWTGSAWETVTSS